MSSSIKTFQINGQTYKYKGLFTISFLLSYLGFKLNLIVIDYNGTILQKDIWPKTFLKPHDKVEILTIAGGG